jgi:hypothetical protein
MSQGQGPSLLFNFEDFVRITNHLPEEVTGRYDGRDYVWEAAVEGQDPAYLDVHKIVATHIFGWLDPARTYLAKDAQEIRERAMLRLGWVQPIHNPNAPVTENPLKPALRKLQKISIGPLPPFQNVRLLRPKDADGNEDPNRAPVIDVLPAETEPAPRVASGTPVGAGEAPKPALPKDPQENVYQPPQRVEQVPAKKGAK